MTEALEYFNNQWVEHCDEAVSAEQEKVLDETGKLERGDFTYYNGFSLVFEGESEDEADDPRDAEIEGYAKTTLAHTIWDVKDEGQSSSADDEEITGAWRFTSAERDVIVLEIDGLRYPNGDLAMWTCYRFATEAEFKALTGGAA